MDTEHGLGHFQPVPAGNIADRDILVEGKNIFQVLTIGGEHWLHPRRIRLSSKIQSKLRYITNSKRNPMDPNIADKCRHTSSIRAVTPSALGCEECLKAGSTWVHLRLCRSCGHVGCCDSSPGKHATAHFQTTGHPIIEGYDPPEGWGWCYLDEVFLDLSDNMTPHNGSIPRYY
jgi:hypothetical protein